MDTRTLPVPGRRAKNVAAILPEAEIAGEMEWEKARDIVAERFAETATDITRSQPPDTLDRRDEYETQSDCEAKVTPSREDTLEPSKCTPKRETVMLPVTGPF